MPKQRKVFAMQNFLGLDKENKPLKVAPFRASDGYNFEIDSQTLKTRKGFVVDEYIKADMATGDSVVEWYEYQGVTLYITEQTFYVVNGDTTVNLKTSNNVIKAGISSLDNTDKNPIFREEKNALFIFGLDAILVFSMITQGDGTVDKYVIYNLGSKPANPYDQDDDAELEFFNEFEELPKPYEPTLFIGDTPFEDVNLLSNINKYRLFANQETIDGYVKYYLPTQFDPEKNGSIQTVIDSAEITFYQNAFDNLEVYPIFLGIDGENFDYDNQIYGSVYNATNFIIEDTFFPKQVFEFYKDYTQDPPVVGDTISKIYALKKEDFFILRMGDTSQSVFEYLLNLIKIEGQSLLDNQVVKFSLPVEYTAVYRPDTDYSTINEKLIERETVDVYVQLRKFDSQTILTTDVSSNILVGTQVDVLASDTTSVAYPTISGTYDATVELDPGFPGVSVNNTNFLSQSTTIIQNWLAANKSSYLQEINNNSGSYSLKIQLDMFYPYDQLIQRFVNISNLNYVTKNVGQSPYPSYPSFTNPNSYPVQTINESFSNTLFYPGQDSVISFQLDNFLTNNINTFFGSEVNGFGIVKYQYKLWDYNFNTITYVSAIALVEFQKEQIVQRHIRNAATTGVTLTVDEAPSQETLYNLSFNADKNWFELEVRDYFYDYNNEPSIDVKFTFPLNPDYDLIAKNKFGIFFGSEDRLFLAGHPDYPNIDRYNVSNDLLGGNFANQSYELSYFPSRNYRVLGGKGRINGYVVATDTQLYITKEEYPNDSNSLFVSVL